MLDSKNDVVQTTPSNQAGNHTRKKTWTKPTLSVLDNRSKTEGKPFVIPNETTISSLQGPS